MSFKEKEKMVEDIDTHGWKKKCWKEGSLDTFIR